MTSLLISEGWASLCWIASVGCSLPSVVVSHQCTPAGKIDLSIAVSTVTGRFMLKPDPTTTNYILYLLVTSFASSLGCRGRELGGIVNDYYNLLLYIVAATSASFLLSFHADINCWLILISCCKTSSEDASLR